MPDVFDDLTSSAVSLQRVEAEIWISDFAHSLQRVQAIIVAGDSIISSQEIDELVLTSGQELFTSTGTSVLVLYEAEAQETDQSTAGRPSFTEAIAETFVSSANADQSLTDAFADSVVSSGTAAPAIDDQAAAALTVIGSGSFAANEAEADSPRSSASSSQTIAELVPGDVVTPAPVPVSDGPAEGPRTVIGGPWRGPVEETLVSVARAEQEVAEQSELAETLEVLALTRNEIIGHFVRPRPPERHPLEQVRFPIAGQVPVSQRLAETTPEREEPTVIAADERRRAYEDELLAFGVL